MKKASLPPPGEAHDDREIQARRIAGLALGFAAVTLLVLGIAWLLTDNFSSTQRASDTPPPPIASAAPTAPPAPRLEPFPPLDLTTLRAEEAEILGTYAWVDRPNGVVSIPIDRAIELTIEQGLPARHEAFPATSVTLPTPSSLKDRKAGSP